MTHRQTGDAEGTRPPRRHRRRPRRWNKRRRTRFLETLAESCNVSAAARAAGMDRSSAYDLKEREPAFARGWRTALEKAHDELAWRLLKRAKDGNVRTELTVDLETGKPKQLKMVHNYSETVAVRLYLSHQAEVLAFRESESAQEEEDIGIRLRAEMDIVRARLRRENGLSNNEAGNDKQDEA